MTLITNRPTQKVYRFPNGFGASVISDGYGKSEGLFEIAVVKWTGNTYSLNYDTPITNDVLGYLTEEQVESTLAQIEALDLRAIEEERKAKRIAELEAEIAAIRAE